jgi:hypothetical protein
MAKREPPLMNSTRKPAASTTAGLESSGFLVTGVFGEGAIASGENRANPLLLENSPSSLCRARVAWRDWDEKDRGERSDTGEHEFSSSENRFDGIRLRYLSLWLVAFSDGEPVATLGSSPKACFA